MAYRFIFNKTAKKEPLYLQPSLTMNLSTRNKSKKSLIIAGIVLLIGVIMQFTGPEVTYPKVTGAIETPPEVANILKRACYDCHSNQTQLSWFDKVAPISWLVASDVREARSRFNFSEWDKLSAADQRGKLWEIFNMVDAGRMPLKSYTAIHPSAQLNSADIEVLKKYITTLSLSSADDSTEIKAADAQFKAWQQHPETTLTKLPVSINGIAYIPDYKNWQVMSTTARFDNGTMRVVYGNEITMQALKHHQLNPWPNGAVMVKVVWEKIEDHEGNIHAGKFMNVQYMIKDDKKYKDTEGWGFARFDSPKLIPYGKVTTFGTQCINCHRMVSQNGFVFDIATK